MNKIDLVDDFMKKEGINCLTTRDLDPHFNHNDCDCCGSLPGNRYKCSGYNPTTQQIQDGYSICPECLFIANYGEELE